MMTLVQYILSKAAEEAGELGKEALKGQQQGLYSDHRGDTNVSLIQEEFIDLVARTNFIGYAEEIKNITAGDKPFKLLNCELPNDPETNRLVHKSISKMCYYLWMAYEAQQVHLEPSEIVMVKFYRDDYAASVVGA